MNYKRIILFGSPGSGKSTVALRLSQKLGIPLYHLDALYYSHNWTPRPNQEFADAVCEITKKDQYIIDGNMVRIMLERDISDIDLIIYLDVPRLTCLWRVIKRYVLPKRADLQDRAPGCEEQLSWRFLSHHLWTYKARQEPRIQACKSLYPHIQFMHVRTEAELAAVEKMVCGK